MARIPASLIVAILIGIAAVVWVLTQKKDEPGLVTSTPTVQSEQPSASCAQSCATCKATDYEARCTDRCKFNFRPYCD
jgi:hypothetical protein